MDIESPADAGLSSLGPSGRREGEGASLRVQSQWAPWGGGRCPCPSSCAPLATPQWR
ncbi:hypothetical protein XHV734_3306 [Xanthomonas hortorum pv. vitians]|nr:hypothetical protein XHV734_3306 [Xanthomonas hortorum pv. vitians]